MGFRLLLQGTSDIEVAGEANSGEEAVRLYAEIRPNVVVMDISMPGIGGLEAIGRILAREPAARILVLSAHEDVMHARRVLKAGAAGYLTKRSAAEELIQAIRDFGVEANDIRTTNFSIYPMDRFDPSTGLPSGEKVYAVDNTVYVTVRNLETLGDLLDTAVQAGANTVNSIQFDVEEKDEALQQARAEAVEDARNQAQALAQAAGLTLGEIRSISFFDAPVYPLFDGKGGGGMAAAEAAVPIQPGQLTFTVSVNVTYELK